MTELVLNGGANRGEILRKMTLSVSFFWQICWFSVKIFCVGRTG